MPPSPDPKGDAAPSTDSKKGSKLGLVSGVYIPVCLNILSILMFLRFGLILGQVGFIGIIGLLITAYCVDLLTTLSLSAIASNGEVKGGGAYYLISRSLGPEFGGSIGILFYLAQVLNTAMNIVGLIDCIRLSVGPGFPQGYWAGYGLQTAALLMCTGLCLLGSATFSKASNALLAILSLAVISIPISAIFKAPFHDEALGIRFTGISIDTFADNFLPHTSSSQYHGLETFRDLFGILFPATSGIFAGASMSGDLKNPSKAIPKGTLWAMLTTFSVYLVVILAMASSTTHESFLANASIISHTNLSAPVILAGECAVTVFSALLGVIGSAKLFQALARDKLLPGLSVFGKGTKSDEPLAAIFLTYAIAQVALFADLNQIATFISMGYQMTFFVMNLACFLLKIGSAPNFRPGFQFFSWQTAFLGSLLSAAAMFFIDETYAAIAICVLVCLFLLIHYLSPPKLWGDVSQNLIYHQVRKYLLRLRPEHIKFWRPHIILLINDPRRQTRLIQFCNSMKKGSLYILGHVIVTDDFNTGVHEARLQQHAWTNYISEFSRIKAFVQLTMSPSITWGIRNLILSAGLGGMRPNIAVLGFYNMDDLRKSNPAYPVPDIPTSPTSKMNQPPPKSEGKAPRRRRGDTSARLLEGFLPTDVIRTEPMMSPKEYMTMLEDLALRYRLNVAVGYGFDKLETPRKDGMDSKKYIDLWPIQMSAEVESDGKNLLTTNFDTYTLILQLGHILRSVHTWRRAYTLRVMVFVEYESEVEEESARVKALLEKLRIHGKVVVFWLASGQLNTYELIINGNSNDMDWEIIVNEALRDEEWWDDLERFRGRSGSMSSSQVRTELAHIMDSTARRPGVYNPHENNSFERRRPSVADFSELPKNPAISMLSKMGVNMGIHTHRLNDEVLQDSSSDYELSSDSESSESNGGDYAPHEPVTRRDVEYGDPTKQPLLRSEPVRRRGNHNLSGSEDSSVRAGRGGNSKSVKFSGRATPTYGTMSTTQTPIDPDSQQPPKAFPPQTIPDVKVGASPEQKGVSEDQEERETLEAFPSLKDLEIPQLSPAVAERARSVSPTRRTGTRSPRDGTATPREGIATPIRPNMSRQSSAARFSSRPVPETTITSEGEGSKISFAQTNRTPDTTRGERPTFSRQSSLGKFSSRQVPETKVTSEGEGSKISFVPVERQTHSRRSSLGKFANRPGTDTKADADEGTRSVSFAPRPVSHSQSAAQSRLQSRQGSQSNLGQGDISLSIPELLRSYKLDPSAEEDEGGSTYSTQGLALSFNDLPSRAQHLILNELMRQNSSDTAVLLSTLPIPAEGTSLDDGATVQYLSDVEVLCNELPPTLMVLSNNMTVTVSL